MEFLMISKCYLNTLMQQQFLCLFTKLFPSAASAVFPTRAALYSNVLELLAVKSALLAATSSLLNCYKPLYISE